MARLFWGVALAFPAGFLSAWALKSKVLNEIHVALTRLEGAVIALKGKV